MKKVPAKKGWMRVLKKRAAIFLAMVMLVTVSVFPASAAGLLSYSADYSEAGIVNVSLPITPKSVAESDKAWKISSNWRVYYSYGESLACCSGGWEKNWWMYKLDGGGDTLNSVIWNMNGYCYIDRDSRNKGNQGWIKFYVSDTEDFEKGTDENGNPLDDESKLAYTLEPTQAAGSYPFEARDYQVDLTNKVQGKKTAYVKVVFYQEYVPYHIGFKSMGLTAKTGPVSGNNDSTTAAPRPADTTAVTKPQNSTAPKPVNTTVGSPAESTGETAPTGEETGGTLDEPMTTVGSADHSTAPARTTSGAAEVNGGEASGGLPTGAIVLIVIMAAALVAGGVVFCVYKFGQKSKS